MNKRKILYSLGKSIVYFLKTVQIHNLSQCTCILYIGYTNHDT